MLEMEKRTREVVAQKLKLESVGGSAFAVAVGKDEDAIEKMYELCLIQNGFFARTLRPSYGHCQHLPSFGCKSPGVNAKRSSFRGSKLESIRREAR